MQTTEDSVIISKTRELCQLILDQPEYQTMRRDIEVFLADESAKEQYRSLSERGEHLQHKQQQGVRLSDEEVSGFEQERERLFTNPVARGFLDAQQSMHKVQETISQYVGKTFELGRIPGEEDFGHGGCGHGCGCSH